MKTRDVYRRWRFISTHYIRLGRQRSFYVRVGSREYRFQLWAEFRPSFEKRTIGKQRVAP